MHEMDSEKLLSQFQTQGFVHLPVFLDMTECSILVDACQKITSLARGGGWPYIRTVPKQFPPWPPSPPPDTEGGIWGVQHLLHPDAPGRDAFAQLYFDIRILSIVEELVGVDKTENQEEPLVMELFNLLVSPSGGRDFELRWHRDDVSSDLTPNAEQAALDAKRPGGCQPHAQYNISLFDDTSLIVIPGSHLRARTEIERLADPLARNLPGQLIVHLKPGDVLFYDNNLLHRGAYQGIHREQGDVGRMTLHGSVGLAGHGELRARNVLQHGVGQWIEKADFGFPVSKSLRAEGMKNNLVAMGRGTEVGYSHHG